MTDLEGARVLDVVEERTAEAADQLWESLSQEQKQTVEAVAVAQSALAAGIPLASIHVRDPFILPVEQEHDCYLVLVASAGLSVTVRQSEDLMTWGEPKTVFAIPDGFWSGDAIWAPEIHRYRGRYYLFATFINKELVGGQWTNWPPRVHRGTQVLVADSPLGPFKWFANYSHTPTNEMALDGTLWVEDGRQNKRPPLA